MDSCAYALFCFMNNPTWTFYIIQADPSGVKFLLTEGKRKDPMDRVIYAVSDLEESIM